MLKDLTSYLEKLKNNNNRDWFWENKEEYQKVRKEFEEFMEQMILEMMEMDPKLGLLGLKDCVYRVNRDIRFTKDKSPYKPWMSGSFSRGGKKGQTPGYYFSINTGNDILIGGGFYMPSKERLDNFRQKLMEKPKTILDIIEEKKFKREFGGLDGDSLKKLPRGFNKDVPEDVIDLMKLKNILTGVNVDSREYDFDSLKKELLRNFKIMQPLIDYLRMI